MKFATFKTQTKIRDLPGLQSKTLEIAQPGDIALVLSEAITTNGLVWHKLQHYRQIVGYSATNVGEEVLYTLHESDQAFDLAVAFTLKWEGGYVNNPADPGGETNFGISKRSYPWLDIAKLTKEHATLIYYRDFWNLEGWEAYPYPKCAMLFDIGVMSGPAHASALSGLTEVGIIAQQLKFLANLTNFSTFGRGWVRRTVDLLELLK